MTSGPDWVPNSMVNGSVSDGHSQFANYRQLNPTFFNAGRGIYNLDWTASGLAGADLK